jgi:hypothetical protein
MFWTPAFAGVTLQETSYEAIKVGILGKPVVYPPFHYSIFSFFDLCASGVNGF